MRRPAAAALLRVRNPVVLPNLNVNSLPAAAPSRAFVVIVLLKKQGLWSGAGGVRVGNRVGVTLVVGGFRVGLRWVVPGVVNSDFLDLFGDVWDGGEVVGKGLGF
ncbi:hypothetical protein ACFX2J_016651 [Malus domestica]